MNLMLTSMIHAEADLGWRAQAGRLWALFPGSVDYGSPAAWPGGRGSTDPGCSFLARGAAWCWSGCLRQGAGPVPGGHDLGGPGQLAWIFRNRRRRCGSSRRRRAGYGRDVLSRSRQDRGVRHVPSFGGEPREPVPGLAHLNGIPASDRWALVAAPDADRVRRRRPAP